MSRIDRRREAYKTSTQQKARPKPRTKSMLLPLRARDVRDMSNVYLSALSTLRTGTAERMNLQLLDDAIFFARFYHQAQFGLPREGLFDAATEALERCARAEGSHVFRVDVAACIVFLELLKVLETQLLAVPAHLFHEACNELRIAKGSL
jgi:hypothetical protein